MVQGDRERSNGVLAVSERAGLHLMRLDTPAVANRAPSRSNSMAEMMEEEAGAVPPRDEGRWISATSCSSTGAGEGQLGVGRQHGVGR